jgi:GTP-binding protein EngB required for normal cell division
VDAPGYGFARMNKKRRELWFGLTEEYMKVSSRLSQIFVCINIEHGLKNNDIQFLERCERYNIDVQVILTKVDKLPPKKYFYQLQAIVEGIKRLELKKVNERIIAVSSKTKFGIEVMRMRLIEAIEKSQQRNIDNHEDMLLTYVKDMRVQRTRIEEKQPTQSKHFLLRKLIYNSKLTKYLK